MESNTLNVSLPKAQVAWIRQRKDLGNFGSVSAVVQALITKAQAAEAEGLRRTFRELQPDGVAGAEPTDAVVALCRKVKRERLAHRRAG